MKKYIEVIIKNEQNNKKITKTVVKGYAFNYLIPYGLAEIPTKGKIKHLKMLASSSLQKRRKINELGLKIKNELKNLGTIHLRKKCGQNYQIFGSVSEQDIQERILTLTGQRIEKKHIKISNVKQIGIHTCYIFIHDEIKTSMNVRILPYQT